MLGFCPSFARGVEFAARTTPSQVGARDTGCWLMHWVPSRPHRSSSRAEQVVFVLVSIPGNLKPET